MIITIICHSLIQTLARQRSKLILLTIVHELFEAKSPNNASPNSMSLDRFALSPQQAVFGTVCTTTFASSVYIKISANSISILFSCPIMKSPASIVIDTSACCTGAGTIQTNGAWRLARAALALTVVLFAEQRV